jgi:hypothetical protein
MRPRIRTVKPEMRQDERYGRLSYPARELFNGLITMADDEGRFRAPASAILGHVFPYDEDAPRKLRDWVAEVKTSGMVIFYVADGLPYGAFRHWRRHQKINRPRPSDLPPPPDHDIVTDNSVDAHDAVTNGSVNEHGERTTSDLSHAQARVPVQIPEELQPHLEKTFEVLEGLAERHGAKRVNRDSLASVMVPRSRKPLVRSAYDCAAWWDGQSRRLRDVVSAYRNWLDRTDDLAGVEQLGGRVVALERSKTLRFADRWQAGYEDAS